MILGIILQVKILFMVMNVQMTVAATKQAIIGLKRRGLMMLMIVAENRNHLLKDVRRMLKKIIKNMTRKIKLLLMVLVVALILPISANAHPGRTNASGCHTCKTNCGSWGLKKGEYHCHVEKVKKAKTEAKSKAKNK